MFLTVYEDVKAVSNKEDNKYSECYRGKKMLLSALSMCKRNLTSFYLKKFLFESECHTFKEKIFYKNRPLNSEIFYYFSFIYKCNFLKNYFQSFWRSEIFWNFLFSPSLSKTLLFLINRQKGTFYENVAEKKFKCSFVALDTGFLFWP